MHSEDMHANWASHIIFHLLDSGMTLGGDDGNLKKDWMKTWLSHVSWIHKLEMKFILGK